MSFAISINPYSLLVRADDGSLFVFYDGKHYARDQVVPFHIFGATSNPSRYATAGSFVTSQMVAKFGDDRAKWPEIARMFVSSKDA